MPKQLAARLNIAAPETAADRFMWMPGGTHAGNFSDVATGEACPATVIVNRAGAEAVQSQFSALCGRGKPYLDFNHQDGPASFWPEKFEWADSPAPGIYVQGKWSSSGKAAIEGREYRSFSPVFWADESISPSPIVANPDARLNLGGLVNAPAFRSISPFFAREGHSQSSQNSDPQMKLTLQQLQAKVTELETALATMKTAATPDAHALAAKESELALTRERVKSAELEGRISSYNEKLATDAIAAAKKRGAIPAQDTELSAKYKTLILADPTNVVLVESLPGNPALAAGFTTTSQDPARAGNGTNLQAAEGLKRTLIALGEFAGKNAKLGTSDRNYREKALMAQEAAVLYRKYCSGKNLLDARAAYTELKAADFTDANLGILSGTLVAQRTLELFRLKFYLLKRVTTDFSDQPAALNQVINTRIIVVPAILQYDNTVNAQTHLPNGWAAAAAPQTTNVNVTMNKLFGVPIRFGLDILSETVRRLFDELAPASRYAMEKYMVEQIYALLTPANFNAYNVGGATTSKVPTSYATYSKGLIDFGRGSLVDLENVMDPNEVPQDDRTVLLIPSYHGALEKDPSLTTFYAGQQDPEIITEGRLPMIAGFLPLKAANLLNNNNTAYLTGFALQKSAVAFASRLPVDINEILPGATLGSVITVTDAELGLSIQLVQYVNQTNGFAEWRLQAIFGCNVGDNRGGLCITSE